MTQPRIGIYPGTFDPITNGHTDIIRRAIKVVDQLVIGVARNDGKGPLFPTDERVEIVRDEIAHLENGDSERVEVRAFDTLLVNFVLFFFFQAEDGIRDLYVTGVQTCAIPISKPVMLSRSGTRTPRASRASIRPIAQ